MTRLRKLKNLKDEKRLMSKTASFYYNVDSEMLNSGDVIGISSRSVNNKPWFQVYLDYGSSISSFYDGDSSEKAYQFYIELLLAFKGVKKAEQFKKNIPLFDKQIEKSFKNYSVSGFDDYYHNLTMKKPSFLGYSN